MFCMCMHACKHRCGVHLGLSCSHIPWGNSVTKWFSVLCRHWRMCHGHWWVWPTMWQHSGKLQLQLWRGARAGPGRSLMQWYGTASVLLACTVIKSIRLLLCAPHQTRLNNYHLCSEIYAWHMYSILLLYCITSKYNPAATYLHAHNIILLSETRNRFVESKTVS